MSTHSDVFALCVVWMDGSLTQVVFIGSCLYMEMSSMLCKCKPDLTCQCMLIACMQAVISNRLTWSSVLFVVLSSGVFHPETGCSTIDYGRWLSVHGLYWMPAWRCDNVLRACFNSKLTHIECPTRTNDGFHCVRSQPTVYSYVARNDITGAFSWHVMLSCQMFHHVLIFRKCFFLSGHCYCDTLCFMVLMSFKLFCVLLVVQLLSEPVKLRQLCRVH